MCCCGLQRTSIIVDTHGDGSTPRAVRPDLFSVVDTSEMLHVAVVATVYCSMFVVCLLGRIVARRGWTT